MTETLKLVIVGHVDHGKSTLIGRLLYDTNSLAEEKVEEILRVCEEQGKDPEFAFVLDYLEEERKQGITIDTAKTFFSSESRDYIILDAPGHVEFIKNMITGASQADVAILLLDVNEGVQEQTRRHAYLLSLLGIKQVIVALNKIDLVNYDKEKIKSVKSDLALFLDKLNIKPTEFIPISAKTGENVANRMDDYEGKTILEALDELKSMVSLDADKFVFTVQDVYKSGEKRINVGKVESGTVEVGDLIKVYPDNKETKVKSIEEFQKERIDAKAGECVGLVTDDPLFIERGNVISKTDLNVYSEITANIFCIKGFSETNFQLRCSTQEIDCKVEIIETRNSSTLEKVDSLELGANTLAKVKIAFDRPIVVDLLPELKRFILTLDNEVLAGGMFEL